MQTSFSLAQLADPAIAEADKILRACVHCGFCTATCPTYLLLGDEDDSPRGRIYLIKDMLEKSEPARREVVKHIDRCLSCLSCMTTCPSGVHYMHLVDHARAHVEKTYRRPYFDRLLRTMLLKVLPDPKLFRLALFAALLAKPLGPLLGLAGLKRLVVAMLELGAGTVSAPQVAVAEDVLLRHGRGAGRVALLSGCVANALAPEINAAAIRVLNRHGFDVVIAAGEGCCGSLAHHMGHETEAHAAARRNISAWINEIDGEGLDAILTTAVGLRHDHEGLRLHVPHRADIAGDAARVSSLVRDISEFISEIRHLKLCRPAASGGRLPRRLLVAARPEDHGRCRSEMLARAGFAVKEIPEGHICCGSAGTYNLLQPDLANRLRDRKIAHIQEIAPDLIAAGNIGCITQIAAGIGIPVVHPIELIDWATGGPAPRALESRGRPM